MATITVGPGQRYQSIGGGINAAGAGDTVLVAGGTYGERVTVNKTITVKTTEGAKIQGSGTLVYISANNATFDGFTVERINWQSGRDDIVEVRGNGVAVKNCTVYIANVTNLAAAKAAFGKEKASGIIFKSNNVRCENNEVWGACFGVAFSDNTGRNSVVRNCNLHHTDPVLLAHQLQLCGPRPARSRTVTSIIATVKMGSSGSKILAEIRVRPRSATAARLCGTAC